MPQIMENTSEDFERLCELLGEEITFDVEECCVKGCDGTLDKTKRILKEHFPMYNATETIEYFNDLGGYCDCEILLNVSPDCECDCDEDGECECECCTCDDGDDD
jgi:hypothetical protein